jgi:hypothetical protein
MPVRLLRSFGVTGVNSAMTPGSPHKLGQQPTLHNWTLVQYGRRRSLPLETRLRIAHAPLCSDVILLGDGLSVLQEAAVFPGGGIVVGPREVWQEMEY